MADSERGDPVEPAPPQSFTNRQSPEVTPLRIALHQPWVATSWGGTETRCIGEARWLLSQGHSVIAVRKAGPPTPEWEEFRLEHLDCPGFIDLPVPLPSTGDHSYDQEAVAFAQMASPRLVEAQPDLVVVYYSSALEHLPRGLPYIYRAQGHPEPEALRRGARFLDTDLRAVLAVSGCLLPLLEHTLRPEWAGPLLVLPGGVDIPTGSRLPEPKTDVIVAARLIARKDPEGLVATVAELEHLRPDTSVLIAGDGPRRRWIAEQLAAWIGRGVVALVGRQPRPALFELMRSSGILLHTGVHDAQPNAIQEAMAIGIPVVAPAIDGLSELVPHGLGGMLTTPGDPAALAAAAARLLDDCQLRTRMSNFARQWVNLRSSWERVGPVLEALYRATSRTGGAW